MTPFLVRCGNSYLTKNAVVPNFQHSDKLKALLVAAQKEGAKPVGLPSDLQPLGVVLECFSFAKQRFDSTVDPCAKMALMLLPVTTVLAFTASDARLKPEVRNRAREGLEFLTSKNVTGLGISADWGIVWEAFLRLFDAGDHDIAASSQEIDGLIAALEKLFVDGGVFHAKVWKEPLVHQPAIGGKVLPPTISHNMQAAGVDGQFITTIVGNQLQQKCVFNVGGDPVLLWGQLAERDKAELGSRIQNVAKVSIGRLRADFPKSEMRSYLQAVHMPLVQPAFGPGGTVSKQEALTRCCKAALNSMGCPEPDEAVALVEYKELASCFARLALPGRPLATKSNREIWGHCLDDSFLREHFPGRPFLHFQDLIRYYQSIEDGSCNVERGLAGVRAYIKEFQSNDIGVVDDLAVLTDAQLQPEDFAVKRHGVWEVGPFGLECGALWREVLGARMGIYHLQKQRAQKTGTYKHVKAGVLKAIGAATTATTTLLRTHQQPSPLVAALAKKSIAGTPGCPHWHKGFLRSFLPIRSVMCFWGFA